jgi:hypothetical protein
MTVQIRIYVPLSVASLRGLRSTGRLEPAPFTAYAVTTDLRRSNPAADAEELEYLAFTDAVAAGSAPVVAAADVDADLVTDLLDGGAATSAVRIARPVSRREVASFHVADVDGGPDYSWYDATELDAVLELLG